MQIDLEQGQANALAAHLEVATRTYAAHLAQAQAPIEAIPEIIRQLQSVHEIATAVAEAAQEQE
jgi:hypothetical protein